MRFAVLFHLLLALFVGVGPFFKGQTLVLCTERDGTVVVETLPASFSNPPSLAAAPLLQIGCAAIDQCPSCSDTLIGPAHSQPAAMQSSSPSTVLLPPLLHTLDPLPLRPLAALHAAHPPAPGRFSSFVPAASPPLHLPSTLLLI